MKGREPEPLAGPTTRSAMTLPTSIRRFLACLKLPKSVSALVTYARSIVASMTGNAWFTAPTPTLAVVAAAIDALQAAETATRARTTGAVALRNEARSALVPLLQHLAAYVQETADANLETGASIIESAGIAVRKAPVQPARVFGARSGPVSGSAKLMVASAGPGTAYDWEYSVDAGTTWLTTPSTMQAKTTVWGLQPGARVLFRYRVLTRKGEGDWSQPAALIIR